MPPAFSNAHPPPHVAVFTAEASASCSPLMVRPAHPKAEPWDGMSVVSPGNESGVMAFDRLVGAVETPPVVGIYSFTTRTPRFNR